MKDPAMSLAFSADAPRPEPVLTKAVLRAAERLGVPARALSGVLGLSPATLSRMKKSGAALESGSKSFELAVLFVRLYRALDAIAGGEDAVAKAWLANPNTALGAPPIERIQTISGLVDVIAYLDARRALV
jgi:hypothetical protein